MYDIIIETHNSPTQSLKALVTEINERTEKGWSLRGDYNLIKTKDGQFVASQAMTRE